VGGVAATVAVFVKDTQAPVLGQQQWDAVHQGHARGLRVSAIARELELERRRSVAGEVEALPAHRARQAAGWASEVAGRACTRGQLLGTHPVAGTAGAAWLRWQLRDRSPCGRAAAPWPRRWPR
jgi:hypothetical protein